MPFNVIPRTLVLSDPEMRVQQVLPLLVQVDLGVIPMKEYSIFPKVPLLEPHHQMLFSVTCWGRSLNPPQRCSQCILLPQPQDWMCHWTMKTNLFFGWVMGPQFELWHTASLLHSAENSHLLLLYCHILDQSGKTSRPDDMPITILDCWPTYQCCFWINSHWSLTLYSVILRRYLCEENTKVNVKSISIFQCKITPFYSALIADWYNK